MPTNDDQAPAKRADLWLFRGETEARFDVVGARLDALDMKMEDWKKEIIDHFDVVMENLVHDFQGIFKDRLEHHEDRITRLERQPGFVAA